MKWNEYYNRSIPKGAERVVKKFAWLPINFPLRFEGNAVGTEYRWLEIVYIKQKWSDSIFGGRRWFNVEFATKTAWLNTKIYN